MRLLLEIFHLEKYIKNKKTQSTKYFNRNTWYKII
jgi:hypothetical protein